MYLHYCIYLLDICFSWDFPEVYVETNIPVWVVYLESDPRKQQLRVKGGETGREESQ